MFDRRRAAFSFLLLSALATAPAAAANRFTVAPGDLVIEKTGQTVTVLCDNDFHAYGFQASFKFDPAKLRVNSVALGSSAAGAGWENLDDLNSAEGKARMNATGEVMVGAVLDFDPSGSPAEDRTIPIGTGHPIVVLSVEVLATAPGTALIDFTDTLKNPANGATIKNILTTEAGTSIGPVQEDGTIPLVSWKPEIQSLEGNSGWTGKGFQAVVKNLDVPGASIGVALCGMALAAGEFSLGADGKTLTITAPACGTAGFSPLTVTTAYGSDTEPDGFEYIPPVPVIEGVLANGGQPGAVFQATGRNFDRPGLAVKVCGKAAAAVLRADLTTLDITAPECALGWATLEVCNDVGCDTEANGFQYTPKPVPVIDGVDPAEGEPGASIVVTGRNFGEPGLSVRLCGKDAPFALAGDAATITVTAPDCPEGTTADLEVCTEAGCATAAFRYIVPPPPAIDEIRDNEGGAGKTFQVVGRNFARAGRTVKVCGTAAVAILDGEGTILTVTAPACAEGWAVVEVCTDAGCDSQEQGFHYLPAGKTFIRGDANEDAEVDLSDAIGILSDLFLGQAAKATCRDALDADDSGEIDITDAINILNFLFLGGGAPVTPYPDPGYDATPSEIPSCL